ncbi:MAG: 30S ribosomal protein S8 [Planctomycetes bacterium]|nr:30S ribosomal protein S8 [Planctomycetota bacterium]
MSMTDPIADMLTRIRNANAVGKKTVSMPSTKVKLGIAEALKREGFITDFEFVESSPQNTLVISLKYGPEGEKVIQKIVRGSSPGRRLYTDVDSIPEVLNGLGISIISTDKGILSDREARLQRVGGEVLCSVW